MFETIATLERSLDYHRDRHVVLAGNVANVDTPNYQPLDLVAPEGESAALELTETSAGHQPRVDSAGITGTIEERATEAGGDGNGVVLERELAKIDANRIRYGAASELVSRRLALLKYGATDGA